jgi:hypothetical protein
LGFSYIHDIVREEAIKKGFSINEKTQAEVQLWLTLRQWELETITPEDWVADKSLLDYLVYGEILLKEEVFKKVVRKVVKANGKYDYVFFLPIEFPMELDGLRSNDLEFQKLVEQVYLKNLSRLKTNYLVLSGSVETRIAKALKQLAYKKHLKQKS